LLSYAACSGYDSKIDRDVKYDVKNGWDCEVRWRGEARGGIYSWKKR
jgi:hypothetical protein